MLGIKLSDLPEIRLSQESMETPKRQTCTDHVADGGQCRGDQYGFPQLSKSVRTLVSLWQVRRW